LPAAWQMPATASNIARGFILTIIENHDPYLN
jgi:hypothetical protein